MLRRSPIKRKPARNAPDANDKAFWSRIPRECQACGFPDAVIHHLLTFAPGKISRRDHRTVVRLCPACHNMGTYSVHLLGSERKFLEHHGIDLMKIAVDNRERYDG